MPKSPEHDNRRKYQRSTIQRVVVILNDKPYLTHDWSPDGFSVIYKGNDYQIGDEIKGGIDVFEVEDIGTFTGTVTRKKDTDFIAVQFEDVSSHIFLNLCMTVSLENEDVT